MAALPALRADGKRYACWRPLVAPDRDRAVAGAQPSADQCLAALRGLRQHGGRWAVVMLRGGHFAAAVFGLDPARVGNPRQADKFETLAHKSAHRYVVRWGGQGGGAVGGGGEVTVGGFEAGREPGRGRGKGGGRRCNLAHGSAARPMP